MLSGALGQAKKWAARSKANVLARALERAKAQSHIFPLNLVLENREHNDWIPEWSPPSISIEWERGVSSGEDVRDKSSDGFHIDTQKLKPRRLDETVEEEHIDPDTGVGWRRVRRVGELVGVRLRFFIARLFYDERLPPELGYGAPETELSTNDEWNDALAGCPLPSSHIRREAITFAAVRLANAQDAMEPGCAADAATQLWELTVNRTNHEEVASRRDAVFALVDILGAETGFPNSTEVLSAATAATWTLATSVKGRAVAQLRGQSLVVKETRDEEA